HRSASVEPADSDVFVDRATRSTSQIHDHDRCPERSSDLHTLEAAYRNRTDDLRITRRIPTVHHRPVGHSRPAREAPRSAHVQGHAELLLADPLARPGHHSVAFATFTTPRPSTSSRSNAPPRLTCLDCSKRPLTWGTVSRQFSMILVPSVLRGPGSDLAALVCESLTWRP